jgi:hypothetical protein
LAFKLGGGFSFLGGKIELATCWFLDLTLFKLAALSLSACTISAGVKGTKVIFFLDA